MKRFLFLVVFMVIAASLVMAGGSAEESAEEVVEKREITYVDQNFSYTKAAAAAFKEHVERETDGVITVTVLPWDALGGDRDVIEQLVLGEVEVFNATTGSLSGEVPEVQMTNMPFLFENRYIGWELFEDPEYLKYVQNYWLENSNNKIRLLGGAENSIRNLYTVRGPVKVPADLEKYNIKMRVPQIPMYVNLWDALGAPAIVSISASERYSALQSGLMDGTEGGLASAWPAGLLEICDYVTLTGHMFDHHYYVINNDFYESLSPEFQEVIDEAGALAAKVQSVGVQISEGESLQLMKDADKVIYEPTSQEKGEWREVGVRVGTELLSDIVPQEYMDKTFEAVDRVKDNLDMAEIESEKDQLSKYID
ncbi:MAG: TRAP transporter substrate-binding protein [Spirochaetia bacterium]|nr:TRAP transporter substrate-binding protein [Spirochaetia bacterium]